MTDDDYYLANPDQRPASWKHTAAAQEAALRGIEAAVADLVAKAEAARKARKKQ